MKFIVERINEDFAILEKEDLSHLRVDIECLPENIKEGSILFSENGSSYEIDTVAELQTRNRIIEKQRGIFKRN